MAPLPPTKSKPSTKPTTVSTPHHRITKRAPLKRAKLISKHAALLSRLNSKTQHRAASKVATKRRRPSKKLVTNLNSLADALPTTPSSPDTRKSDNKGIGKGARSKASNTTAIAGQREGREVKIKHTTLKSAPGVRKKKEKIVAMERERFARNLAEMAKGDRKVGAAAVEGGEGKIESGSAERWAAIRNFIKERMELAVK